MARPRRLIDIVAPIFSPPFKGLAAVIWGYFVVCFLINPDSGILKGNFSDPDDYLHLTQAIDLIKYHNWFDPIQYRMNPPEGTFIHFSKILSLFYALLIYPLSHLLGMVGAATIVAAIVPIGFFSVLLAVMIWTAKAFMDESWAAIAAFTTLFATALIFKFAPGQVDHHGVEAILSLAAFGCIARMMAQPAESRWPAMAGAFLALSLAIALEVLPLIILIVAWVGLWAMVKGGKAARAGMFFGLALFVASFGLLLLTQPQHLIFNKHIFMYSPAHAGSLTIGFSIVYVVLMASMALCLAGIALASRTPWASLRYIAGIGLALATGTAFLFHFPELRAGPYGGMDKTLAKFMFENINEALPIIKKDKSWMEMAFPLLWPSMALAAGVYFLTRAKKTQRWMWGLAVLLLVSLLALAALYQGRAIVYAQLFCPIPLALALQKGWMAVKKRYSGCSLCAARLGIILLVGPLPMVLFPATLDGRPFNTGVLFFANVVVPNPCDMHVLADMLTLPEYYGDRPRAIINTLNEGSELLFRTPHKILSAPYHANTTGNRDATAFFTATNPAEARRIAQRRGAELVVMCRTVAGIYISPEDYTIWNEEGERKLDEKASFAQKLASGKTPSWLKPIDFPLLGNMLLFEVRPSRTIKK
ncbi:MAG: hypothetical protein SFW62_05320 [Alphaproteobacteria bacterium]|nr:hypothetical protein [Alphaproteobacteria bacterium]